MLVTTIIRKRKQKYSEESYDSEANQCEDPNYRRRLIGLKIIALLAGIIPGILFLILENIRLPLVWITQWTPIIGAFFIIHMAILIMQIVIKRHPRNEKEEDVNAEVTNMTLVVEEGGIA